MSKELPFFKFTPARYLSGDITMCSLGAQGLFTNILCFYWMKGCNMTMTAIKARFSQAEATLTELITHGVIKTKEGTDEVVIEFLKEQREEFDHKHEILSKAGRTGGLKSKGRLKPGLNNKKGKLQPPSSIKEEEEDKEEEVNNVKYIINIPERLKDKLRNKNSKEAMVLYENLYKNLTKTEKPEDVGEKAIKMINDEIKLYEKFMQWIEDNASSVNDLKEPFSIRQYVNFKVERPDPEVRKKILTGLHNWPPLLKKRKVAYTTALNWKPDDNGQS